MRTMKQIREEKGMTQAQLSVASDVSISTIRNIEQGCAGEVSTEITDKLTAVLAEFPIELSNSAPAYWQDELFSKPNPIIPETVRRFVNELEAAAKKAKDSGGLEFLNYAKQKDLFLWLKKLLSMARVYEVKLPKV